MSVGEGGPHERTQPVTGVSQGPLFIFLLTMPLTFEGFQTVYQPAFIYSFIICKTGAHTHHSRQKDSTKLLSQPGAFQ